MAQSVATAELAVVNTWLVDTGPPVLLAEALNITEVLTLDRRGVSTYRTRQRRGLRLVLDMP